MESHPEALAEPDLNLSAYLALIIQLIAESLAASEQTVSGSCLASHPSHCVTHRWLACFAHLGSAHKTRLGSGV